MKNSLIVGLTGQAQSGKDTSAKFMIELAKLAGIDARRYAFADSLKSLYATAQEWYTNCTDIAVLYDDLNDAGVSVDGKAKVRNFFSELFGRNPELANDEYIIRSEESKRKHRPNLIRTGCFMRDEIDKDFWVNITVNQIMKDAPSVAFITDVRFPNEATYVHEVVRVVRPQLDVIYNNDGKIDQSEEFAITGWFDHLIANGAGLRELYEESSRVFFNVVRHM